MMELPEIEKTVAYWKTQANDSWGDAEYLVAGHRYSLGLFAAHLALWKKSLRRMSAKKPEKIRREFITWSGWLNWLEFRLRQNKAQFYLR
jgi:hypothetical protein